MIIIVVYGKFNVNKSNHERILKMMHFVNLGFNPIRSHVQPKSGSTKVDNMFQTCFRSLFKLVLIFLRDDVIPASVDDVIDSRKFFAAKNWEELPRRGDGE